MGELTADEICRRVLSLPVSHWTYNHEPDGVRHVGPMAQDFAAAFGLGDDDRVIQPVDYCGVLLVALQVLAKRIETLEAEHG